MKLRIDFQHMVARFQVVNSNVCVSLEHLL